MLFATTRQFLDDLGIASLDQLPPLETQGASEGFFQQLEVAEEADPAQMLMSLDADDTDVEAQSMDLPLTDTTSQEVDHQADKTQ
jgi:segregation and condensation protein B